MDKELLEKTANELVSPGRGILAADESNGTMSKRLPPSLGDRTGQICSLPMDMSLQLAVLSYSTRRFVNLWTMGSRFLMRFPTEVSIPE